MEAARRFHTLEGLRGLAAVAVALAHLVFIWRHIVCHGYLAVDLFFLLSGVVLGHAYGGRLSGGWSPAKNLLRRAYSASRRYIFWALSGVASVLLYSCRMASAQAIYG